MSALSDALSTVPRNTWSACNKSWLLRYRGLCFHPAMIAGFHKGWNLVSQALVTFRQNSTHVQYLEGRKYGETISYHFQKHLNTFSNFFRSRKEGNDITAVMLMHRTNFKIFLHLSTQHYCRENTCSLKSDWKCCDFRVGGASKTVQTSREQTFFLLGSQILF